MQLQQVGQDMFRPRRAALIDVRSIEVRSNQTAGELPNRGMRTSFDKVVDALRALDDLESHDGWQPIRLRTHGGTE